MKTFFLVLALLMQGLFTSSISGTSLLVATTLSPFDPTDIPIIPGVRQYKGLMVLLDTRAFAEAVIIPKLPLLLTLANGAVATDITDVRLYDGNIPITTGLNILNPTRAGPHLISFDGTGLLREKGKQTVLYLRFDLRATAIGTFQWSVPTNLTEMQASGLTTAMKIVPDLIGDGNGPLLSVYGTKFGAQTCISGVDLRNADLGLVTLNGTLSQCVPYRVEASTDLATWKPLAFVSASASGILHEMFPLGSHYQERVFFRLREVENGLEVSLENPYLAIQKVSPGALNVNLLSLRYFNGRPEALQIRQIALKLNTTGQFSSAVFQDRKVTVWYNGIKIGEVAFFSGASKSYGRLYSEVTIPPLNQALNGSVVLDIKGDISLLAPNGGATLGDLVTVDYDGENVGINGNYAVGMDSGMNVLGSTLSTTSAGVKIIAP